MKDLKREVVVAVAFFTLVSLMMSCGQGPRKVESDDAKVPEIALNTLTEEEKADGFILMFNGLEFDGWRGYNKPAFPEAGWVIDNGTMKVEGAEGQGGDIIYDRKFKDFHLKLEWMVPEGENSGMGNSGIFYLAKEIEGEPIWKSAPEMQIINNEKYRESYPESSPMQMAGSLYDLVAAEPQNALPAGQWNTVEIMLNDGKLTQMQNGAVVAEIIVGSDEWNALVAASKFAPYEYFGQYEPGYIGLQDHGDALWFRNIRVKEL